MWRGMTSAPSQLIMREEICGTALEPAVAGTVSADSEYDFGAFNEMTDHLRADRHVILQIGIERDHRFGFSDLREQTSQQCILVVDITRQLERANAFRVRV